MKKKTSLVLLVFVVLFMVWLSGCLREPEGPGVITSIQISKNLFSASPTIPIETVYEVNKTQDEIHFKFYTVYTNYNYIVVNREGLISDLDFENLTDFIESVNFSSFEDVYESEDCYGGRSSRIDRIIVGYSNQSVKEVSACYKAAPDDFYTVTYLVKDLEYKVITNNITFNIENNLDENIYFDNTDRAHLKIFRYDEIFEYLGAGNWTQLRITRPCPTCGVSIPSIYELKPGESKSFVWDGTYYKYVTGIDFIQRDAEPGRYKAELCYSLNFTSWEGVEPRRDEINPYIMYTTIAEPIICVEKEFNIPHTEGIIDLTIGEEFDFEEVIRGEHIYFIPEDRDLVIKDSNEWCQLFSKKIPPYRDIACPSINFDEEMVIAVFMGGRGSGGYSIAVKSIIYDYDENTLIVNVERTSPGPGCPVTLALTSPFQMVKTKKIETDNVKFQYVDSIVYCERSEISETAFLVHFLNGGIPDREITLNVAIPLNQSEAEEIAKIALNTSEISCTFVGFNESCDPFQRTDYGWRVITGPVGLAESVTTVYERNKTVTIFLGL